MNDELNDYLDDLQEYELYQSPLDKEYLDLVFEDDEEYEE